jgi:hypothetical protein
LDKRDDRIAELQQEKFNAECDDLLGPYSPLKHDVMDLQTFIQGLAWRDGEWCKTIEGADLQYLLEHHGLIKKVEQPEPCCDQCKCAEEYAVDEFPVECYRWTGAMS